MEAGQWRACKLGICKKATRERERLRTGTQECELCLGGGEKGEHYRLASKIAPESWWNLFVRVHQQPSVQSRAAVGLRAECAKSFSQKCQV